MKWLPAAAFLAALMPFSSASAVQTSVSVLVDADRAATTGCVVDTAAGSMAGVDEKLVAVIDTHVDGTATMTALYHQSCADPNAGFDSPQALGGAVGVHAGLDGFHAIEMAMPMPQRVQPGRPVQLGVAVENELGQRFALLDGTSTGSGPIMLDVPGPLASVPLLGIAGLSILALAMLAAGAMAVRRKALMVGACLMIAAGGAGAQAYTFLYSWSAVAPLAQTQASDPDVGVEVRALFAKTGTGADAGLIFRVDGSLSFPRSVGGSLAGLLPGGSVILQDNGADDLTLEADGSFAFATPVASGTPYNVTVLSQPANQTCTVSNGSGTVGAANVTNVQVTCSANTYTVGGTISGLVGSVTLQDSGGDTLSINTDGSFTFATPVASGASYNVTVISQPATQTCTVSNGSGTVGAANITNVQVMCSANTYTVGGTVSGLVGSVMLQNNGGDTLSMNADGGFTFATPVAVGAVYNVTVSAQPANQTCTVSNGSGTMGSANVTNVQVTCSTNTYTVGGTVSGLLGNVTLQNNGGDTLSINTDGSFTFATPVASGASYNVTVISQPATQTCTVSNGSGTVGAANITNVQVTCSANTYTVGGTVSGLLGSVTLQNNGGDMLSINTDGSFTFSAPVAFGASYNVTVSAQPATQTCSVSNGSGTMSGANVTNVLVTCSTNTYTVGGTVSGLLGSVILQNNGGDMLSISTNGGFTFATPVAVGAAYNVTVSVQPATQTCTVFNGSGLMGGANVTNVAIVCTTLPSQIQLSLSQLAVSVNNTAKNPALTGTPRILVLTNTGSTTPVVNLAMTVSNLPAGSTVSFTTCGAVLPPGASCTAVITPGATPSSDCSNGTAPVAAEIAFTADNAPTVSANVTILDYGCLYQGGHVFAIEDTTPNTGSVGGKLASPTQLPPQQWADVYSIVGANSETDGAANTALIVSTMGPLDSAAKSCAQSSQAGYADWYLPAICELTVGAATCPVTTSQNIQSSLVDSGVLALNGTSAWSSTEGSASPQTTAWFANFPSNPLLVVKISALAVECVRSMSP